jgi:hypothetical protein
MFVFFNKQQGRLFGLLVCLPSASIRIRIQFILLNLTIVVNLVKYQLLSQDNDFSIILDGSHSC